METKIPPSAHWDNQQRTGWYTSTKEQDGSNSHLVGYHVLIKILTVINNNKTVVFTHV